MNKPKPVIVTTDKQRNELFTLLASLGEVDPANRAPVPNDPAYERAVNIAKGYLAGSSLVIPAGNSLLSVILKGNPPRQALAKYREIDYLWLSDVLRVGLTHGKLQLGITSVSSITFQDRFGLTTSLDFSQIAAFVPTTLHKQDPKRKLTKKGKKNAV